MYDSYEPAVRHSFLGGSLGAGATFHATEALSLATEGRWHTNLTSGPWLSYEQPSRRLSLLTLTAGATIRW